METPDFEIQTNPCGRKILIINNCIDDADEAALTQEDFDAMLITLVEPAMDVDSLIVKVNPLVNRNSMYDFKPLFIHPLLKDQEIFYKELADGFSASIDDKEMCDRIEEIIHECRRWNIRSRMSFFNYDRPEKLFSRIYRFCISRGKYTPEHKTRNGSTLGYVRRYFNETHHMRLFHYSDFIAFHENMVEKGYLKEATFVNRVQTCPVCMHTHLLFLEMCPKCAGSKLTEENIIHHFRCANVSPENNYMVDDKLICPKCHRELRHIGVDYDRPSSIYFCQTCENSFLDPDMRVICTTCKHECSPEELVPYDFYDYTITPEGIDFFTSENIVKRMLEVSMPNVVDSMHTFMVRVSQLANMFITQTVEEIKVMIVLKVWLESKKKRKTIAESQNDNAVLNSLFDYFSDCYVSKGNNMIWVMHPYEKTKTEKDTGIQEVDPEEAMIRTIRFGISESLPKLLGEDKLQFRSYVFVSGQNINKFIEEISKAE